MASSSEELGWVIHPGPMIVDSFTAFRGHLNNLRGAAKTCLIVDRHYEAIPRVLELVRRLESNFPVSTYVATSDEEEVLSQVRAAGDWTLVIGVGGGVALDVAKLAALDDASVQIARQSGRSSRVLLPGHRGVARSASLALVPSTFGTGSELSLSACINVHGRKRLISGPALGADLVLSLPHLLSSLDDEQMAEGIVEIALRLSTVYANGSPARFADAQILAALKQLVELSSCVLPGGRSTADLAALASLSAFSHTGWLTRDRGPVVTLPWILVTEFSLEWSCSKAVAAAALLPSYWKVMERGNKRLGSFDRLNDLWTEAIPGATSPTEALSTLVGGKLPVFYEDFPTENDIDAFVSRIFTRWGAGLPYLGDVRRDEIREVLITVFNVTVASQA